jgi:hypothetical protein
MATKYIRTKENKIIVFSALFIHSDFKMYNPVSAGFINFLIDNDKNIICECYGKSVSLELESRVGDSRLAQIQIVNSIF